MFRYLKAIGFGESLSHGNLNGTVVLSSWLMMWEVRAARRAVSKMNRAAEVKISSCVRKKDPKQEKSHIRTCKAAALASVDVRYMLIASCVRTKQILEAGERKKSDLAAYLDVAKVVLDEVLEGVPSPSECLLPTHPLCDEEMKKTTAHSASSTACAPCCRNMLESERVYSTRIYLQITTRRGARITRHYSLV